ITSTPLPGKDTNDGRAPQRAWLTIDRANGVVQAADTVVLSGTFRNQAIFPRQSGTTTALITYRALQPLRATIDGPGRLYPNNPSLTAELAVVNHHDIPHRRDRLRAFRLRERTPERERGTTSLADHITVRNSSFTHVPLSIESSSFNIIAANTF